MILLLLLTCFVVSVFFKTKTGLAIYAGGVNPKFAEAALALTSTAACVIANHNLYRGLRALVS